MIREGKPVALHFKSKDGEDLKVKVVEIDEEKFKTEEDIEFLRWILGLLFGQKPEVEWRV